MRHPVLCLLALVALGIACCCGTAPTIATAARINSRSSSTDVTNLGHRARSMSMAAAAKAVNGTGAGTNHTMAMVSTCYDPGTWEQLEDAHNYTSGQFIVVGSAGISKGGAKKLGGGAGNELVFFATEWVFAAVSGRRLMVDSASAIGSMCNIVHCGFPSTGQMAAKYPAAITPHAVALARPITAHDMARHMREPHLDHKLPFVRGHGYMSHLNLWWVNAPELASCVAHVTGCVVGDVACAERHALQQLIRGPFMERLAKEEEKRIRGIPAQLMHSLLELPHAYAPRIDIAVHLRVQFHYFEAGVDPHSEEARAEELAWFNSTERVRVFAELERMFYVKLRESLDSRYVWLGEGVVRDLESDPFLVYVAGDNEFAKRQFMAHLRENRGGDPLLSHCLLMFVETAHIQHIVFMVDSKDEEHLSGLVDTTFDWYALSLSRIILNWRRTVTDAMKLSTFVHSACRMSGNHELSNSTAAVGHGAGSRAFSMYTNKHGEIKWTPFFEYVPVVQESTEAAAGTSTRRNRARTRRRRSERR